MIKRTPRIPMRDLSTLTGEDADTARKNRLGGRDLNIFRIVMNHPQLTRRWAVFAAHVLHKQTLPPRERELLILRIGWLNQAEYEWAQHVEIARRSGISTEEIERIKQGPGAGDYCLFGEHELEKIFTGWAIEYLRFDDFPAPGDTLKRFSTLVARANRP